MNPCGDDAQRLSPGGATALSDTIVAHLLDQPTAPRNSISRGTMVELLKPAEQLIGLIRTAEVFPAAGDELALTRAPGSALKRKARSLRISVAGFGLDPSTLRDRRRQG